MSRRTILLAALAVALSTSAIALGVGSPIDASTFSQRLRVARDRAVAATRDPASSSLTELLAILALPVDIGLPSGVVTFERDPFLAGLAGNTSAEFNDAAVHLGALADALDAAALSTPDDRAAIDAALARAYAGLQPKASLTDRIREKIANALRYLLEGLATATEHGLGRLIAILVGLAFLAAAVWFAVRRTRLVPERSARARDHAIVLHGDPNRALREALARGDFNEAVRAQYALLLRELAARDVVPEALSVTAGECRQAVAIGMRDLHSAIEEATGDFERVMYGRAQASERDLAALRRATELVRAA